MNLIIRKIDEPKDFLKIFELRIEVFIFEQNCPIEEEFDTTVDNMSALIEPIMIVFMGVMIGGLMIAMYSPIFNVGALIN